jgi:ATP-binding cassette subfamily B protein
MSVALSMYLNRLSPPPERLRVADAGDNHAAGKGFAWELRHAGLGWRLAALLGAHAAETALLLGSWTCIGLGALSGRLDAGWLAAWALALGTTVPLRAASIWLQGVVALGVGGLIKQRLLAGAMAIDADFARSRGAGQLMSEVLESETIDDLGSSGGVAAALALLELLIAPFLLLWGADFSIEAALLFAWIVMSLLLMGHNARLRSEWTRQRIEMTHRLVEKMTAHRTRLAQQPAAEWHRQEDRDSEGYLIASRRLDISSAGIEAALSRGYVLVAFLVLSPAFVSGRLTIVQLAITLGTILFAAAALQRLCFGFSKSAAAWIAWRIVKPTLRVTGAPAVALVAQGTSASSRTVMQARGIVFDRPHRRQSVLSGCTLSVERGDRILLEGASGSGKSTLASILAGARSATSGSVLLGGLDRQTLGDIAWRGRIALAPQYHENHILAAPLILNLLMGRPYPHTPRDIEDAAEICRELGLGELLERMPAGLHQQVGDTGWRLSQGERSRIYLARALLQNSDVVLLDESLAALDPDSLRQCLNCVMRRAPSMILIAHP